MGKINMFANEGVLQNAEERLGDWEKDSLVKTVVSILCDKPSVPDSLWRLDRAACRAGKAERPVLGESIFFGNVESNDSPCLRAQNFGQISRMLRKQIWYIQISHEPRMRSHMRKYWERSSARGSFGGRAEPSNGKVKLGYLGCLLFLHLCMSSWSFVVLSCFVVLFKV